VHVLPLPLRGRGFACNFARSGIAPAGRRKGFSRFWSVSLGSRPAFLPSRLSGNIRLAGTNGRLKLVQAAGLPKGKHGW
jgi:hypothetical protein